MRLLPLLLRGFLLKVNEAIVAVMEEVRAVGKDGYNSAQKFNFRGIDAVVNAVALPLRNNGVIVAPVDVGADYRDSVNGKGTAVVEVRGTVTYRWTGPEGDYFDVTVASEARDFADKATAKFMSVAFRTCLLQTLALPTDDPDPDSDYPEVHAGGSPDADVLTVLRNSVLTDVKAFKVPDEAMGDLVQRAGIKTRVSLCTDQVALQKLSDLIRAEHG